ncbi:MAG: sulfide/dihydroorotate dehydrogenase-like FAD/NAD-binding protein [Candidatus Heimdallarchaeota archaeon]|nr:sulfide/dihydroorotate dehydrogenase-like FAD/NAD-binding protein [Candidatus Heimdallarchaeota archaeon]
MYEIIEKKEEVPNVHRLVIREPNVAAKAKPGQFVILMPDEKGERVPISIADTNGDTFTVFVLELGISSAKIGMMNPGEKFYAVTGPLGLPATINKYGKVVLGGGCYGIGALYPIAKALKEAGNEIYTIIEARSAYLVYYEKELRSVSDEFYVATSDGSRGTYGHVQDVLDKLIKNDYRFDHAKFIGCTYMMMNCSHITLPYRIPTTASLNTIMLDGTGMCGCCRVTVGGETKFACVHGPEFDAHKVDWEELMDRKTAYHEEEMLTYQTGPHVCRALIENCLGDDNE